MSWLLKVFLQIKLPNTVRFHKKQHKCLSHIDASLTIILWQVNIKGSACQNKYFSLRWFKQPSLLIIHGLHFACSRVFLLSCILIFISHSLHNAEATEESVQVVLGVCVCRLKPRCDGVVDLYCGQTLCSWICRSQTRVFPSSNLTRRVRVGSRLGADATRDRHDGCGRTGTFSRSHAKIPARPHNQNKSTTRAFPAAMTSRKPSPFPASKNKTLRENVRVSHRTWAWCGAMCGEGRERTWTLASPACFLRKLGRFGGRLTGAGAMKGEAEVKSLDRPSMLLLLFW